LKAIGAQQLPSTDFAKYWPPISPLYDQFKLYVTNEYYTCIRQRS